MRRRSSTPAPPDCPRPCVEAAGAEQEPQDLSRHLSAGVQAEGTAASRPPRAHTQYRVAGGTLCEAHESLGSKQSPSCWASAGHRHFLRTSGPARAAGKGSEPYSVRGGGTPPCPALPRPHRPVHTACPPKSHSPKDRAGAGPSKGQEGPCALHPQPTPLGTP